MADRLVGGLATVGSVSNLYQPRSTGFAALKELDQVDWSQLHHAFGVGVSAEVVSENLGIAGDVKRSLAQLAHDPDAALGEGLYSNICHQGAIYEATAYAVPFLIAVGVGDIPAELRLQLLLLLGDIAIGASFVAPSGTHSGSIDAQAADLTNSALTRSLPRMVSIRDKPVMPLTQAIAALVTEPSDVHREALGWLVDSAS